MADWSTACLDWEERILQQRPLVPELPLFQAEAARGLRVFKRLRIPDIIGTPTMAEACGEWFFPIVTTLFGSYDPDLNMRMIQEYFLLIPKGNSKSSYGGPLMLAAVILNRRPEAEFDFIAPTIKIAQIAFGQAVGTIKLDPELDKLFHIQRHIRTITHRTSGAKLQIKAADTDVVTGGKAVGTMIDETHVFAKKSNAADIFVELRGSLLKRKDGFLFQTTTQSKDPPQGQFKIELDNARAVRDGELKLPMLPILYEYPDRLLKGHQWKERRYWPLVNPNIGRSVDESFLERELLKAEREGVEQLLLVASQHFNVQIGLRLRGDRWAGADYWEQCGAEQLRDLDALLDRVEVAVIGIDGGGLDDLTGICVLGRDRRTKMWLYWTHAFAHRKVLTLRKEIAPALLDFEQDGDLTFWGDVSQAVDVSELLGASEDGEPDAHPRGGEADEDIAAIVDICVRVRESGLLAASHGIGVDPAALGSLLDALVEAEFTLAEGGKGDVHSVSQSATNMLSAIVTLGRKLEAGTAAHGGTRLMAWCVSNAKAELRGNAVLITKAAAGKAKIDPLIAAFVATKIMERNPEAAGGDRVDDFIAAMKAA